MAESKPCDGSCYRNGGVNRELDLGHVGMHRWGEHGPQVIYWSDACDVATRAELVAELGVLTVLYDMAADPEKATTGGPHRRLTSDGLWSVRRRVLLILETLFGSGAV